jgi:subtilase family serine protease
VLAVAAAQVLFAAPAAQAAPSSTGFSYMNVRVCGTPALGNAACDAVRHVVTSPEKSGGSGHKPGSGSTTTPVSYDAGQLQAAYGLAAAAANDGSGVTVAVVDAYNDPNAYTDLVAYRTSTQEGLGGIAQCTVSGSTLGDPSSTEPCLAQVNQSGATSPLPTGNTSWGQEISLDLDMVSAICPKCNILLVEANSANLSDLGTAVNTAASFSPASVGNSYGAGEFSTEASYASLYYNHPGIAVTVAAGDNGYGVEFPAAASTVVAVGGTSLQSSGSVWSQTVWSGTGSGCSAYIAKPSWQTDPGCPNRTVADIAADADPNTGVNVYDSYGTSGWLIFGGTSVAAQIVSAVYGLANTSVDGATALYGNGSIKFGSENLSLYDVVSGSNGSCAGHGRNVNQSIAYLCTAGTGYDGPTGMGTPNGSLSGF